MKKFFSALAASALMLALSLSEAQAARAIHGGHDHAHARRERARQGKASRVRRRASDARKMSARRAPVSYACPMHPDMSSGSRGECHKCGMVLVAARRGAKPTRGGETVGGGMEH